MARATATGGAEAAFRGRERSRRAYNVEIPPAWQHDGVDESLLRGHKRALRWCLLSTTTACVAVFAVQVWYYASLTTTVFEVQSTNALDGYACVPLSLDPTFGLNLTEAECVASAFEAPSASALVQPFVENSFLVANAAGNNDGPWDYLRTSEPSLRVPTYYHMPLPGRTRGVYAYDDQCALPLYKGFENDASYSAEFAQHNPLKLSYIASLRNGANRFVGYGFISLANWVPNYGPVPPESFNSTQYKTFTFKPSAEILNVNCSGSAVNAATLNDVRANGAVIYVRVHGMPSSQMAPASHPVLGLSLSFPQNAVGMTVMYPEAIYPDLGKSLTIAQRCEAYEAQMAAEAFAYLYSYCHPCDHFAQNAPFICTATTAKNVIGEVLSLSVGNAFALFDCVVIVVGVLLVILPERISRPPSFTESRKALIESPRRERARDVELAADAHADAHAPDAAVSP